MLKYINGKVGSPDEEAYGAMARAAWTAFAKDPVNGLSQPPFSWPKFSNTTSTTSVLKLALDNKPVSVPSDIKMEYGLCEFVRCLTQLNPPPKSSHLQRTGKEWVQDPSKPPRGSAIIRLFRKHGKMVHAQMSKS
jgi:hypothetical protein